MQRILALTLTLGLLALPVHAHDETHSIANGGPGGARLDEYWTEERMKAAVPMPLPVLSEEEFNQIHPGSDPEEDSPVEPARRGVPERANVDELPFSVGGKLFFTLPDGSNSSCSGQFVAANVVMTAAHCLRSHATGVWYSNFSFVRGYNDGDGQTFNDWRCAMVFNEFVTLSPIHPPPNYHKYDYGFINTGSGTVEHWLELRQGIRTPEYVTAMEYPMNYGDGKYMYKVDGYVARIALAGTVEMADNPFEGSSGGAWINLAPPTPRHIIGLDSFIRHTSFERLFGSPLFDERTAELAERAADNCRDAGDGVRIINWNS